MLPNSLARVVLSLLVLLSAMFAAPPESRATTICSGTCPPDYDPTAIIIVPTPPPPPTLQITGLGLAPSAVDFTLNVFDGDVTIHAPDATLEAYEISLRAMEIDLGSGGSSITILAVGDFLVCTIDVAGCDPFVDPDIEFSYDPPIEFHLGLSGPLAGVLEIYATGRITITDEPFPSNVPEPGTALLLGLGLSAVALRPRPDRSADGVGAASICARH